MSMKPLGPTADRIKRWREIDPEFSVAQMAKALNVTTQRVYQIIATLEKRGDLPREDR